MTDKDTIHNLVCKSDAYVAYETDEVITWCGGCGNYTIQNALKRALVLEGLTHRDVLFCFDVGCNGNGSDKIEGYTIHGLHGRVLPLAAGAKIANHKLRVIASAGDGATFSEGVNHLVHAVRNDYPVLFLLHDNQNYGLTTGQASSTTPKGCKMKGTPGEVTIDTINPLELALSLRPSFVASTMSADIDHMTETIRKALHHDGFAFVHILQACPTYNRWTSNEWYLQNVVNVDEVEDYDRHDIWQARRIVEESEDKIPIGFIYENPDKQNYLAGYPFRDGVETALVEEVERVDVSVFLEKL